MERVRFCLAGCGRAGLVHGRSLVQALPRGELVALVDASRDALEAARTELGVEQVFTDLDPALAQVDCDAVCVAAPTFTHVGLIKAAAGAGKHIFCEKPLALTLEECDQIDSAVRQAGVKFQMGFMRRYDRSFRLAAEKIRSGEIGEPILVRSLTRGPGLPPPWACDPKTSIGMLAEVNSHDFDTLRWLMGSELEEIFAMGGNYRCPQLEVKYPGFYDTAVCLARFRNRRMGLIDGTCPADYGYDSRAEVLGTEGVVFVGSLKLESVVSCTRTAGVSQPMSRTWRSLFKEAYREELNVFIKAILEDRPAVPTVLDGRRALEGVLAAAQSMRIGQPVRLSEPEERLREKQTGLPE